MATDKPRFTITVSEKTLEGIISFQEDNFYATRSKAIQELIKIGISELNKGKVEPTSPPFNLADDTLEVAEAYAHLQTLDQKNMVRGALGLPPLADTRGSTRAG